MSQYPKPLKSEHPRNLLDEKSLLGEIPVSKVNVGKRFREEYGNLQELILDIEQRGLIHPIAVMKYASPFENYEYFLLAGGRRLRAFQEMKREMIPATIYPSDLNGYEIRAIELSENIRRKDMTDLERLRLTKELHDVWVALYGEKTSTKPGAPGHSARDTAKRLGTSISKVSEELQLGEILEQLPVELTKGISSKNELRKLIKKVRKNIKIEDNIKKFDEAVDLEGNKELIGLMEKSYIVGDFFEGVKKIPDETIDFVDLDIDYPMEVEENYQFAELGQQIKTGAYKSINTKDFEPLMKNTFKECYRVMRKDSWIVVWFGYEYFSKLQAWAKEAGFKTNYLHGKWYKGGNNAHTANPLYLLAHSIEPFFYFKKGSASLSSPHPDVFDIPPTPRAGKGHPFEKPVELMSSILNTFIDPGSRILVPFAGSGNTLVAGFRYKCHGVGFELSDYYKNEYKMKIREII